MHRKVLVYGAVAGSYLLLVSILVLMVVALTAAITDGWKLRQAADARTDSSPRFSPDGTLIAFIRVAEGPSELWVMADDGTDARPLARADRFAWTKRGDLLLSRGARVFRVGPDGGFPAAAGSAALPDGAGGARSRRREVYTRDSHIWVRGPDGSVRELT
jgi:dipeptidyl aminopeptidase/acylaminoacyl peptidase